MVAFGKGELVFLAVHNHDAGFRLQVTGCRMQDAGFRLQDARYKVQDSGIMNVNINLSRLNLQH